MSTSIVQRTVTTMLRTYGRDEAMEIIELILEDSKVKWPSDVEFFTAVYELLEATKFEVQCVGANEFKIVWYVPPQELSLRIVE